MSLVRADAVAIPLGDETVDLIVTSPPYFALRSYTDGGEHYDGQIGSEPTPQDFLEALWTVTAECARVLKPSGSIWVNLGDKYSGVNPGSYRRHTQPLGPKGDTATGYHAAAAASERAADVRPDWQGIPAKSLMGLPWRYAIGCIDHLGLILRAEVIWSKPNGLPESVTDRVRRSHEQWFHFTKSPRYYAAVDEVREAHAPQSLARASRDRVAPDRSQDGVGSPNTLNPADACNPLGKLPGSVWEGLDCDPWERMMLSGPPAFCPRCGRDLSAGSGPATRTRPATGAPSDPTATSSTSTGSPTSCSSDPSPTASPSTTSAATGDAATPRTSRPSPDARTSSAAGSRSKPTACTGTASTTPTPTSAATAASAASAGSAPASGSGSCVCEGLESPSGPSSIWSVASEPLRVPDWLGVDHFAAFPQELPRRIILGWSPPGICTRCGDGRRPVVDRKPMEWRESPTIAGRTAPGASRKPMSGTMLAPAETTITGYACACPEPDAPTRPAVVLDPFGGTGTTAMVARALGRYPVHMDLSADYLRLAQWRIYESGHAAKTVTRTNGERRGAGRGDLVNLPAVAGEDQLDLFGGAA